MTDVYPLKFEPILKPKIWGGRKLESLLGKKLPPDEPIGESWEIADLEDDQSVVLEGPQAGKSLGSIVKEWGGDLLGDAPLFEGRFPLLIKFLDANETLSVQVHPDKATAKRLGGRVRIKNEAWYILDADETGLIHRGVHEGVDADKLRQAIREGQVDKTLRQLPARKGHCYYLPSGTIHALGAGVVVAEVQTPSDITYRVYDWDRNDPATGSPRELHLEQALDCISFDQSPITGETVHHNASVWATVTTLVRCESFSIDRVRMVEGVEQDIPIDRCFVIWMILEGECSIEWAGASDPCMGRAGETILLPAGIKKPRVKAITPCMWLEVSIPLVSSLTGLNKLDEQSLREVSGRASKYVGLGTPQQPPS